jgi:hypothetical protein
MVIVDVAFLQDDMGRGGRLHSTRIFTWGRIVRGIRRSQDDIRADHKGRLSMPSCTFPYLNLNGKNSVKRAQAKTSNEDRDVRGTASKEVPPVSVQDFECPNRNTAIITICMPNQG